MFSLFKNVSALTMFVTAIKSKHPFLIAMFNASLIICIDVCLSILRVLQDGFGNPKYAPCPLLVNMVTAGKLGVKSGEGFYSWTHGTKELVISERFSK